MMTKHSKLISFAIILATLGAVYPGLFSFQGAWLVGDHAEQHYPWAIYLSEHLRSFKIPFHTDLVHAGFPITAEGQIGTFYLPNLIFYSIFPIKIGYALNILTHLILSAFFMTKLLRSFKLGERAVLFGTLTYLFGSTLGGAYYNITSLKVLCWLPAALLTIDHMFENKKLNVWTIPTLGFLFSLQILAGYLQYATYAILFAGLYGLLRIHESLENRERPLIKSLLVMTLGVLICVVLSFPQLLLTYQLAIASNRVDMPESFAYISSYPPLALICLLFPNLEGLFASKLYLGVIPIFFIICVFSQRVEKPYRAVVILAVISFLLALGQFSPLYIFIVKILHFHSFRTPTKFIFFTGFFLSILSAYGLERCLNSADQKTARAFKIYYRILVGLFVCVLGSFILFRFCPAPLNQLGEWLVKQFIYGKPGHPYGWDHYSVKLKAFTDMAAALLNPANPVIWIPLLKAGLAIAAIRVYLAKKIAPAQFYVLAVFLLAVDLYGYSFGDIQRDYAPYTRFYKENATTKFLTTNLGSYRYFIYSNDPSSSPLPAGPNMRFGLKTANAYSPLVSKQYYDYMGKLGGVNDSTGGIPVDDGYLEQNLYKLQKLSVKYVVSDRPLEKIFGAPLIAENNWKTYAVKDPETPYRLVPGKTDTAIKILEESDSVRQLAVQTVEEQMLIISQLYDFKWQATVNETPAMIAQVDEIFMGIKLASGTNKVILRYQPFHAKVPFFKKNASIESSQE